MCSYRCETDEVVVQALRPFGTSIFTEMSVPANAHGAVNLSQGFPDFDGPEAIRHKAAEAIKRGPNQYVLSYGIPVLRETVARKMERLYGVMVDTDAAITVTGGATEGLCATLLGILEPGDEVILLEPSYETYAPVSAIPCSCFWNNRSRGKELVRFCFCKKDETFDEAIKRLTAFFGRC